MAQPALGHRQNLELGSGTGIRAAVLRGLGWTPAGVDLSAAMLGYARGRLSVV